MDQRRAVEPARGSPRSSTPAVGGRRSQQDLDPVQHPRSSAPLSARLVLLQATFRTGLEDVRDQQDRSEGRRRVERRHRPRHKESQDLGTNIGETKSAQTRGQAPVITFGQFTNLPTLATSAEYRSCYYTEMDWREGAVYSYNLTIQHETLPQPMVEAGYVGNQAGHLRNAMP